MSPGRGLLLKVAHLRAVVTALAMLLLCVACTSDPDSSLKETRALWKKLPEMISPRAAHGVVIAAGHMYVLGGGDENGYISGSEMAKIKDDGTLGEWKKIYSLNVPRGYVTAVAHNGFIYVVSGANGKHGVNLLNTVERAKVHPDGSIGHWVVEEEKLVTPRRGGTTVVFGGYIYAIGGYNGLFLDTVERSKINPDGSLGRWDQVSIMLEQRYIHSSVLARGNIYVFGGHERSSGGAIDDVEFTRPTPEGVIEQWNVASSLNVARYGAVAVELDGHIFLVGGYDGDEIGAIERAEINPDGTLTPWEVTAKLPTALDSPGVIVNKDLIYLLGGSSDGKTKTSVKVVRVKDGEFISW